MSVSGGAAAVAAQRLGAAERESVQVAVQVSTSSRMRMSMSSSTSSMSSNMSSSINDSRVDRAAAKAPWRPGAPWRVSVPSVSARVLPAGAREAPREAKHASSRRREKGSRRRAAVVLGLVMTSGLFAAAASGLGRHIVEARDLARRERSGCRASRDVLTAWGKRLAVEAYTFGALLVRERDFIHHGANASTPKPFLVPGPLACELQSDRLSRMAQEFQQAQPTVVWYPTVRLEDRAAFEAYTEALAGVAVNITDEGKEATAPNSALLSSFVHAPNRESYNPVSSVYRSPDARSGGIRPPLHHPEHHVGLDVQQRSRLVLPLSLQRRFLEDKRLVAHPVYRAGGSAVSDYSLLVRVPFIDEGCVDEGCFYDGTPSVLGYVSFSLYVETWLSIFPENVKVSGGATGHIVKTVARYKTHARAYEPFLDLDLECHYDTSQGRDLLYLGAAASAVGILVCSWLLRRLDVHAARYRKLNDQKRRDSARDAASLAAAAAAAEHLQNERTRYGFEMSEKTERYLNHELKNRIFVLGQSSNVDSLHGQIDEIIEVLNSKAVLVRLSTGRYIPSWDAVEPVKLIDARWKRYFTANNPFERTPTTGAASNRTALRLDKALFNICLDSMLSNGFKYGDASRPPVLSLNVEPLDGATRVHLSLELRNWAGAEHEALLEMGEEKLNEVALTEGGRAHKHAAELSSGDGFPMAAAAASALGGTVRLVLLPDGVVAKLEMPDVATVPTPVVAAAAPVELSRLKIAMADDSATFRKMFVRVAEKVTSREPILAGATRASIDDFPRMVVEGNVDVLFLDFNFAPVHHTKTGIDLCRECRQLDAEEGNVPRLIFIVSANDSPEDAERYRAAGADGSLGKNMTVPRLRRVLEDAVRAHPRFATSRRGGAPGEDGALRWPSAVDLPPPSPQRRSRPSRRPSDASLIELL